MVARPRAIANWSKRPKQKAERPNRFTGGVPTSLCVSQSKPSAPRKGVHRSPVGNKRSSKSKLDFTQLPRDAEMVPQPTRTSDKAFERGSSLPRQPLLPEPSPVTHAIELTTFPPTNPIPPKDSPHYYKRLKSWARRLAPKPTVLVFIALVIIATVSFCAALPSTQAAAIMLQADEVFEEDGNRLTLTGDIRQFSWSDPEKVSMRWYPSSAVENMVANVDIYSLGQITPVFSGNSFGLDYFETEVAGSHRWEYYAPDDIHGFSSRFYATNRSTNESIPISFVILGVEPGDFSVKLSTGRDKWYSSGDVAQAFSACAGVHLFHVCNQLGIDFVFNGYNNGHIQQGE